MHKKRHASRLIPQGKFLPVLFFADVKSVITPQNDDGVVLHRRGVQRIQQSTQLMIHVADAREIALHEFFPLIIIRHPLVPTLPAVTVRVRHVILKMLR